MKTISRAFPYPVLASFTEDIEGEFYCVVSVTAGPTAVLISYRFHTENETLKSMIAVNSASYSLHLESVNMHYRELRLLQTEGTTALDPTQVRGNIEFVPFVVSTCVDNSYKPVGMHPDYENRTFRIAEGDVLAVGAGGCIPLIPKYDSLKKISSIMQVIKHPQKKAGPFELRMTENKLTILLPEDDHKLYGAMRRSNSSNHALCTMIVLPCLVQAIASMNEDTYSDLRWAMLIRSKLSEMPHGHLADEDPLEIAQMLLSGPLNRSLRQLDSLLGGDD